MVKIEDFMQATVNPRERQAQTTQPRTDCLHRRQEERKKILPAIKKWEQDDMLRHPLISKKNEIKKENNK